MQTKMIFPIFLLFISFACTVRKEVSPVNNGIQRQSASPSDFSMDVEVSDAATYFNLAINNPDKKRLNVQISSSHLGVLVDTTISLSSYNQRYNMNMVEDGQYLIMVTNGKQQLTRKLQLKTIITRNMELVK